MGRKRKHDKDLPERVYRRGAQYIYLPLGQTKYVRLGSSKADALQSYAMVMRGETPKVQKIMKEDRRPRTTPNFAGMGDCELPADFDMSPRINPRKRASKPISQQQQASIEARRARINFTTAKRRAKLLGAMPPWADETAIMRIYQAAYAKTKETGILHHVDHIYPLKGYDVCGLHVADNLKVMHWLDNLSKKNREWYEHPTSRSVS